MNQQMLKSLTKFPIIWITLTTEEAENNLQEYLIISTSPCLCYYIRYYALNIINNLIIIDIISLYIHWSNYTLKFNMKESKMPQKLSNNKLEYGYIIEYYSTVERSNNAHQKRKRKNQFYILAQSYKLFVMSFNLL